MSVPPERRYWEAWKVLKVENAKLWEFVERVAKSVTSPTVLADEAVQLLKEIDR